MSAVAPIGQASARVIDPDRIPAPLFGAHVNLLGWDNGVGLSRDLRLLNNDGDDRLRAELSHRTETVVAVR